MLPAQHRQRQLAMECAEDERGRVSARAEQSRASTGEEGLQVAVSIGRWQQSLALQGSSVDPGI